MAQGTSGKRSEVFVRRAVQLNAVFIGFISVLLAICIALYPFFSLPVSYKLVLYVYTLQVISALLSWGIAFLVRKKKFPVSTTQNLWSYTAVRRYFWSWVSLCIPFAIGFLFFLFAGNLSSLLLGYFFSLCGLIVFRPRRGDVL